VSTVDMMDVEVPVNGTVVVENGNPYEIESERIDYVPCYCSEGKHSLYARTHPLPGVVPHMVGVGTVKYVFPA
jgi:hypothetical protein